MKFWKELAKVFAARARSVRFVYRHRSVVNRKMRRSADAQLRHKPRPNDDRIKLLNNVLSAPRNKPAFLAVDKDGNRSYIMYQPAKRIAA